MEGLFQMKKYRVESMVKKIIVAIISIVLIFLWLTRYYILNNGFAVHGIYPERVCKMHETIEFGENKSYNLIEQPGYYISLESARIVDANDYLEELNMTSDQFEYLSEKYLELTLTVSNEGDYPDGITFYGFPVIGNNWYTFYDNQVTACINPFFENNFEAAHRCSVSKGSSATVKIAYNLYEDLFLPNQWNNIEKEDMWLWVTIMPVDTKVKIEL